MSETVRSEFVAEMGEERLIKYSCNPINTVGRGGGEESLARISSCQSFADYNLSCWLLMSPNSDRCLQFVGPWETLQHVGFNLMAGLNRNMVYNCSGGRVAALFLGYIIVILCVHCTTRKKITQAWPSGCQYFTSRTAWGISRSLLNTS